MCADGTIDKGALDKIKTGGEGEEIFSESKALMFKSVKVKSEFPFPLFSLLPLFIASINCLYTL